VRAEASAKGRFLGSSTCCCTPMGTMNRKWRESGLKARAPATARGVHRRFQLRRSSRAGWFSRFMGELQSRRGAQAVHPPDAPRTGIKLSRQNRRKADEFRADELKKKPDPPAKEPRVLLILHSALTGRPITASSDAP